MYKNIPIYGHCGSCGLFLMPRSCRISLAFRLSSLVPYDKMLPVLFENDEIIVVDKPAGLPAQPGERVGSSVISVVEKELGFAPFPIHRLDKETAGCMLLARTARAASVWSARLAEREVGKYYQAICSGGPDRDRGSYDDDLLIGDKPMSALTRYACLSRFGSLEEGAAQPAFSLLELSLGTGRTHQIRRHMAMHCHPILGDDKYGDFPLNRRLRKLAGVKHLLLWSCRLELPSYPPIRASMPPHFAEFLGRWPDAPRCEVH